MTETDAEVRLADELPPEVIRGIVQEANDAGEDPERVLKALSIVMRHRSGPLPSARELAEYDAACPAAAQEILNGMTENRRHRMRMDIKTANTARLSLVLTWSALVFLLIIALVLGLDGQPVLAGLAGAAGIAPCSFSSFAVVGIGLAEATAGSDAVGCST